MHVHVGEAGHEVAALAIDAEGAVGDGNGGGGPMAMMRSP